MTEQALLEHIKRAQAELQAISGMKAADRDIVGQALTEIVAHLTGEEDLDRAASEHLSARLQKQIAELEADHPKFTAVLERLVNTLASLGI